jgi:hypothetical protein
MPPMPLKCDTICFKAPSYYLLQIDNLPNGSILIAGLNLNNPVSVQRNKDIIKIFLQGGGNPVADINREFIATQLSFGLAGGTASPSSFNVFWSPLRCSGLAFAPVTLTNGVTLSPDSLMDTLITQTQLAIRENRPADMSAIAQILALLNGRC